MKKTFSCSFCDNRKKHFIFSCFHDWLNKQTLLLSFSFTLTCVSWKFVIIKKMHSDVLDLHINLCQLTFPQQVTAIY